MMQVRRAGVIYFALVFGAGFLLGLIRTIWAVPRFGMRTAELAEMPIMLAVIIAAARWIIRHMPPTATRADLVGVGCIALALLLVAEFSIVLWLRGLSVIDYLASRDPVSGTVYYLLLGVFAIMPVLLSQNQRQRSRE
jgi:hypothetical protein